MPSSLEADFSPSFISKLGAAASSRGYLSPA